MKMRTLITVGAGIVAGLMFTGTARAADILCQDVTLNHMLVDDSFVSECLAAGEGNITGNPANDLFLNGPTGGDYEFITKFEDPITEGIDAGLTYTQDNGTGTFSFNSDLWSSFNTIAIGFKFGTGKQPDEWFVYSLNPLVSAGDWEFVNVFEKGGGLSHVNLYGTKGGQVPEPTMLGLFGLGLVGLGVATRRRRGAQA